MTFLRVAYVRMAVVAAAVVAIAAPARADVVIDDFAAPNPAINFSIIGTSANPFVAPAQNVALGGVRNVTVSTASAAPLAVDSATGAVGGGFFRVASNDDSSATSVITYSYASAANFVPTGVAGSLLLTFDAVDSGIGTSITPISIAIATSTGTLTLTSTLVDGVNTTYPYAFSSFGGTGNLASVTGLTITLNGGATPNNAIDLRLNDVSFSTPPGTPPGPGVPAPPALFLALAALPVLGRKYLRKTTTAA